MTRWKRHREHHAVSRIGWLRAAVLGANDGIVSTASLIVGVAAASASKENIILSGVAGLVAGAMSMAAGEYVSVSSQADSEKADLDREQRELSSEPEQELAELSSIYESRGLDTALARQVAIKLTEHDALGAHSRDELGISEQTTARPVQAAVASAATFGIGAGLPLLAASMTPLQLIPIVIAGASLTFLAALGAMGAGVGGANIWRSVVRVTFWGALAMALTAGIGRLFGAVI